MFKRSASVKASPACVVSQLHEDWGHGGAIQKLLLDESLAIYGGSGVSKANGVVGRRRRSGFRRADRMRHRPGTRHFCAKSNYGAEEQHQV
jgi:hypothetical protein